MAKDDFKMNTCDICQHGRKEGIKLNNGFVCSECVKNHQLIEPGKAQRDEGTRILASQQAREERHAPLFEVIGVPEDERTESENQRVKQYIEERDNWLRHQGLIKEASL